MLLLTCFLCAATGYGQKIESEIGYNYTIKKGDTLWDISKQFFDTPMKWPDLWKENPQITNPHWIYPGNLIHLYHDEKKVNSKLLDKEKRETLRREDEKEIPYLLFEPIDRIGFVRDKAKSPSGIIFKVENDKQLICVGDIVYIRKQGMDSFQPGAKFTVYRTIHLGKGVKRTTYRGFQHYLTGVVKIIHEKPRYAVARVIKSYRSIQISDMVMPYQKRSAKIAVKENRIEIDGKIIGSEEQQTIFGAYTIAFIDKGIQDGIDAGQTYDIYYQKKARLNPEDKDNTFLEPIKTGNFIVLHVEKKTATVLITRSDKTIEPGAKFKSAIQ
jgi:hypothetical protein